MGGKPTTILTSTGGTVYQHMQSSRLCKNSKAGCSWSFCNGLDNKSTELMSGGGPVEGVHEPEVIDLQQADPKNNSMTGGESVVATNDHLLKLRVENKLLRMLVDELATEGMKRKIRYAIEKLENTHDNEKMHGSLCLEYQNSR